MNVPKDGASFRLSQEPDNDFLSGQGRLVCLCSDLQQAGQLVTHLHTDTQATSARGQQCQVMETDSQGNRETDRQTARQTARLTDIQTRRTARHTNIGDEQGQRLSMVSWHLDMMHRQIYIES